MFKVTIEVANPRELLKLAKTLENPDIKDADIVYTHPKPEPKPEPSPEPKPEPKPEPNPEQAVTLEDLKSKAIEVKKVTGSLDGVKEALQSFGASRMTDLEEKNYQDFFNKLSGLGG